MRIANPIYDVVFKYLLDDEKVAKLILSALIGREVLDLTFRPTEVRHEVSASLLVLRMDFAATVALEDGSRKLVLIEIQKAHNPSDVLRFRKYLGAQYADPDNVHVEAGGKPQPLPIVTIYFLGEGLELTSAPVVRVNRQYTDAATGEVIPITEPFVEALTHDCIIVQIDRLKDRRRTDLEQLLMVFDQGLTERGDHRFLEIVEEDYPERYQEVIRRLIRATAEKRVRDGMDVEDDYLATLLDNIRSLSEQNKVMETMGLELKARRSELLATRRELEAKGEDLEAKNRNLAEKDRNLAEKDRDLAEKDRDLAEKNRLIEDYKKRLGLP